MIHATLKLSFDAFDSEDNDEDFDLADTLLEMIRNRFQSIEVVEHDQDSMTLTFSMEKPQCTES